MMNSNNWCFLSLSLSRCPGGIVVRSSGFGENHLGSCYCKACRLQCRGNQRQVRDASIQCQRLTLKSSFFADFVVVVVQWRSQRRGVPETHRHGYADEVRFRSRREAKLPHYWRNWRRPGSTLFDHNPNTKHIVQWICLSAKKTDQSYLCKSTTDAALTLALICFFCDV